MGEHRAVISAMVAEVLILFNGEPQPRNAQARHEGGPEIRTNREIELFAQSVSPKAKPESSEKIIFRKVICCA
jgi:hypothetical protein